MEYNVLVDSSNNLLQVIKQEQQYEEIQQFIGKSEDNYKPETEGNVDTILFSAVSIKQLTERDEDIVKDEVDQNRKIPRETMHGGQYLDQISVIKHEDITVEDEVEQNSTKIELTKNDVDWEGCSFGVDIDDKSFNSIKIPREEGICEENELLLRTNIIKQEEIIVKNEDEQNRQPFTIIHKCFHCGHQADNRDDLMEHIFVHTKPKEVELLKCFHCSYQTTQKKLLKMHVLTHANPEKVKKFKCDLCDYQAVRRNYLTKHFALHHTSEATAKYNCDRCDYKTFRKIRLTEHYLIHLKPEEVTWYRCDQCDFQTVHQSYLRKHSMIHAKPEQEKMFRCDQCEYQAIQRKYLKKHYLVHQKPDSPRLKEIGIASTYKCEQCSYQTVRKGDLARHYGVHNREALIYKCVQCGFQTKSKETVTRHMKTHCSDIPGR